MAVGRLELILSRGVDIPVEAIDKPGALGHGDGLVTSRAALLCLRGIFVADGRDDACGTRKAMAADVDAESDNGGRLREGIGDGAAIPILERPDSRPFGPLLTDRLGGLVTDPEEDTDGAVGAGSDDRERGGADCCGWRWFPYRRPKADDDRLPVCDGARECACETGRVCVGVGKADTDDRGPVRVGAGVAILDWALGVRDPARAEARFMVDGRASEETPPGRGIVDPLDGGLMIEGLGRTSRRVVGGAVFAGSATAPAVAADLTDARLFFRLTAFVDGELGEPTWLLLYVCPTTRSLVFVDVDHGGRDDDFGVVGVLALLSEE